ncbi:MAG TPA: type I secretion system permease/ATPase [Methyloceanibacter sp.]|nr:type I secretion system permease/ATPase [Methyloceanibacter sp.]
MAKALRQCRRTFAGIALFSGIINILMLTGALFMLEIYDRVLPSRSLPTLVGLGVLVLVLFAAQGLLDLVRSRILVRVGTYVDEELRGKILHAVLRIPLVAGHQSNGTQPVRDLETVRSFLSGPGPIALFDLPWIPVYLAVIFAFHMALGVTALIGAIVLVGLTAVAEFLSRAPLKSANQSGLARTDFAESCRRNAEVIAAMGMDGFVDAKWQNINRRYLADCQRLSDVSGGFGAFSKVLRMALQSAVLAVGAYLVIEHEATAGIIIAASILAGRALAPVDMAIAQYKNFLSARQSWARLNTLLSLLPKGAEPMPLPRPKAQLSLHDVFVAAPGGTKPIVEAVSFSVEAGQALGVIGPTGSGKSTLLRAIVGVWQPRSGRIRLDGADLDQWSPSELGRCLGYLPQDVELFGGTIAENISRFEGDADPAHVIAAAEAAGVHELIVSFREGYDTEIGEHGQVLSAGQRQRIALARALYRDPFLVVLDEPNSNLDGDGELALTKAIIEVKKRGGIVVIVSHRGPALAAVDFLLAIEHGRVRAFGDKASVLAALYPKLQPVPQDPAPWAAATVGRMTGT